MQQDLTYPPNREDYFAAVWEIVRQIPAGKVATYGQIAELIPPPEGIPEDAYAVYRARWVGYAMAGSPKDVPWQRVVNAQGKVSQRKGTGPDVQRNLLEAEDVVFDPRDRIDLSRFQWEGPSSEWLTAHGFVPPTDAIQPSLFG